MSLKENFVLFSNELQIQINLGQKYTWNCTKDVFIVIRCVFRRGKMLYLSTMTSYDSLEIVEVRENGSGKRKFSII